MSKTLIKPTILFAVRHGESEWNLGGKIQGHLDSPLTELGVQQAGGLAEALQERRIGHIYSSDLGRALRTAEIIAAMIGVPVQTDTRLRERHLGSLQGMTKEEFQRRHPDEWAQFKSGDPDYRFPGGESARDRYQRNVACAEELADRRPGGTILVVAHGGVLSSFLCRALDIPLSAPRRFSLFNAAINRFSIADGEWRLDTWGEMAHFGGAPALDDL